MHKYLNPVAALKSSLKAALRLHLVVCAQRAPP